MNYTISITYGYEIGGVELVSIDPPRPNGFGFYDVRNKTVDYEVSIPGGALSVVE
jgi:hypothetical protein